MSFKFFFGLAENVCKKNIVFTWAKGREVTKDMLISSASFLNEAVL